MNLSRPHPLVFSVVSNVVLFSAVVIFGFPIFNSGDDVYLMYLLGGGFGQEPTELLHYHYIVHPYLGMMLKNLFQQFPNFNWYSACLYLFHFISCTILLGQWLRSNKLVVALLSYALVFFCIEARFLLQPTFTNTALVAATGGMLLLYNSSKISKIFLGSALIVAASMLRMHMLIPVIIIAAPFFIAHFNKRIFIPAISVAALAIALIFLQQQYYKQHIPNWQQEENYRNAVISYYNIPKKDITNLRDSSQLTANLIENGMLWDKTFISAHKVNAVAHELKISTALQRPDFGQRLYWLLMENRLAILVLIGFFIYRLSSMTRREKIATVSAATLLFGLCAGLLLFKKLPPYFIPGCIFVWLAFAGTAGKVQNAASKRNWLFLIIGVLLLAWSIVRTFKLSNQNKQQHQEFLCAYNHVSGSPDKLFIVTDDAFPMDYFHVWHTPQQYMLPNLLYKDHFLNNTYQPAYKKFGITSADQFIDNTSVIFIGEKPEQACTFYELRSWIFIAFKPADKLTNCIGSLQLLKTTAANQHSIF